MSVVRIKNKFEKVWEEYRRVIKKTKRKHRARPKDSEVPLPTKKSSRHNNEESIPVISSPDPVVPQSIITNLIILNIVLRYCSNILCGQ